MKQFRSKLKEALLSLGQVEKAKIYYYIDLEPQSMQIVMYPDNCNDLLLIDISRPKDNGKRDVFISSRTRTFLKEEINVNTERISERILKEFLNILKKNFHLHVEKQSGYRDAHYWMIDKGIFVAEKT